MSNVAPRRRALLERLDGVRATVGVFEGLDSETLFSGMPEVLQSRFANARFKARFAMRHARRFVGRSMLAPTLDDREGLLLGEGAPAIRELVARAGSHILWQEVLRVVRRDELAALTHALGIPPRLPAEIGCDRRIGVALLERGDASLAEAIMYEGALSWACWIAMRDESSARRLRALTPNTVMTFIPKAAPGDAEMRERRRLVIDLELNAMMAQGVDHE